MKNEEVPTEDIMLSLNDDISDILNPTVSNRESLSVLNNRANFERHLVGLRDNHNKKQEHKKNNILVVAEQDRIIDLKKLKETLGTGRLSFGSSDRLMQNLGVRPGAVTPLSMINGVKQNVSLFIDANLRSCLKIYAHPLVNDRTLELSIESLEYFFEKVGAVPHWIDL